jgi:uroporphyrinogen-III decarboxylase
MGKMTSRERMLAALAGEIPDRLPATLHQWQPYHLQMYMGGLSDIEAFRSLGLDAAITVQDAYLQESHSDWEVDTESRLSDEGFRVTTYQITTPEGVLTKREESNAQTTWTVEPLLKTPEEIRLLQKYMPVPKMDKEAVRKKQMELGQDGILRGFVFGEQVGAWQHACCLYGTERMIFATYDDPTWVHEFLRVLTTKKLQYIDGSLDGGDFDLIETGGGAGSSSVISPRIFIEFCLPYDRELHDALHEKGYKVVYHTCGGMMAILDLILQNGCDASETLTPRSIGGDADHEEIKCRIGGKVCLIGGMDQHTILTDGTPPMIEEEVNRLFKVLGPGGRFIMSACDHFFEAPVENLLAYAQAARECIYK